MGADKSQIKITNKLSSVLATALLIDFCK